MITEQFNSNICFNEEDKAKAMNDLKARVAFMKNTGRRILDVKYSWLHPSRELRWMSYLTATITYKS